MSTELAQRQREYSTEQRLEAMYEMALWNGSATTAIKRLREQGKDAPPRATMESWRNTVEYEEVRERYADKLLQKLTTQHEENALEKLDVSRELTAKLRKDADTLEPRDLSNAIRNLDTGAGISSQRAQIGRGQPFPARSTDDRDYEQIIAALEGMGVVQRVGPGAEPVIDAEVVVDESTTTDRQEQA